MRIYEFSKKINVSSKEIIDMLADLNIIVKSHLSSMDENTANKLTNIFKRYPYKKNEVINLKYTKHFDLMRLPFENVPDPRFFFDRWDYARIHHRIKESLKVGRGLMLITGPIGSGKTTLSQMLISEFSGKMKLIWMAEPPGGSMPLFMFIARELGLAPSSTDKTFVLRDIREALRKINSEGGKCLVIMDESHLMSRDLINGIRLLNNLEEGPVKLIQILLLGQDEILELINKPEMEAFKQRIATLEIIGKMNGDKISEYVSYRMHVAGAEPSLFSSTGHEALQAAFNSGGIPRLINSLCDRSLDIAAEKQKSSVDALDIYEAAEGMGLGSDVFHYILALKTKEQEDIVLSNRENDCISNPEELSSKVQTIADTGPFISKKEHNNIKKSIVAFLLYIIMVSLIIFFSGQGSASLDFTTYLRNLIAH